ncbi:hypothetical protein L21SP5_02500 [Salinivirga cyanobacteriivorans]|uniref:Uncharacterized protein n=1 Tax=Salinivirga cyanobacteriivorans TaxID=1307839 RepID=A0A0S2I260_9BACT|nr:hypothetical protein [Salinivirga cyanobacteriivorans]ALO16124.1 hypothetical protein L21SP5_02500 [Salinivirga cyanobacteriivorans]
MKNIFIVFLMCFALAVYGQKGIINNGARIVVENGAYIKVQGDNTTGYTNKSFGSSHGRIELDGEIQINGFFNNNASANTVFVNNDGTGNVIFLGSSTQSIGGSKPIDFEGLKVNGANVNLNTDISVAGVLDFTQGLLFVNNYLLELTTSASIGGTPGTSSMIVPGNSGTVRKYFSAPQSFTYPIGDNSASGVYLPVGINFSSGSFTGAFVDLQTINSKHQENSNTTDYLNRYWTLSSAGITGMLADLSLTYATADIAGTESNLMTLQYDGNFWNIHDAVNTSTNQLTATVSEFGDFTGGGADEVSPHLYWSVESIIQENFENGHIIKASVENEAFASTLDAGQWNIINLPAGVGIGSLNRTYDDTVEVTLSGNRLDDFDSDRTLSLTVNQSQFVHTASGSLTAENTLLLNADNDPENLAMTDDGSITEGSEDGEIITVTLSGGTFAQTLNTTSWVGNNMPAGVALGTITRQSATQVIIELSGNTTSDYDTDITNFELTVPSTDVNEYAGSDFLLTTGVVFKAVDEDLIISMTDGGSGIAESAENGHQITVSIDERTFTDPLTLSEWTMYNLPSGVTIGSVNRQNDTAVYIFLSGNRNVDYDTDITNVQLTIASSQIGGVSNPVTITSGVTFNADNDPESIAIATDPDGIDEAAEDGEVITATITGGTFVNPPQISNWTLSNLPEGVSVGTLSWNTMYEVGITLSGNRQTDFDSHITDIELTVAAADVDDNSSGILASNSITINAENDAENLTLSGGPFTEGNEDGAVITATLDGGTISSSFTAGDLIMTNLPPGVSLGSAVRQNMYEINIVLEGNATSDYDTDITNTTATISSAVVDETTSDVSGTGITFNATMEPAELVLTDNGDLYESEEDGKSLFITVRQDTLVSSISPAGFVFSNFPEGVTAGNINRLNDTTVEVVLSGFRTQDYDTDIINAGVTVDALQFQYSSSSLSASSGWTFIATDDNESIAFSANLITEGAEDGAQVDIVMSGGTFADGLNPGSWSFTGLPAGVSVGSVNKLAPTEARVVLSGNTTTDYDNDIIVDELIIAGSQIDDYNDADIAASGSVTFEAIVETQDLILSSLTSLAEDNLNDAIVGLKLEGATYTTPINTSNFVFNNQPPGLTLGDVVLESTDSASVILAYDGTDFDVGYPEFNITLLAAGSSIGEQVNSNTLAIDAIVEPGELQASHAGLDEENLDGATIDLALVDDSFVDNALDIANFGLINAPAGCEIFSVNYLSSTTASLTIAFDGTDFDTDFTNFAINMAGAEVVSNNAYSSNALLISATNDAEQLTILNTGTIAEGTEDGHVFEVELSGGTFNPNLNPDAWSFTWLPDGTSVSDVIYLGESNAEILINGNRIIDYDMDQVVNIEAAPSEYNDAEGNALITDNTITFESYNEQLNALHDTIYESNLDNVELSFEIMDDWINTTGFSIEDISLQSAPEGFTIASLIETDSAHFTVSFAYDGMGIMQDNPFSLELADSVLNGIEALVSQQIVIANDVGVTGIEGDVELYVSGNEIYLKQHRFARKGSLIIYELNGRKLEEYKVEARSTNHFLPVLKDGMYLIQFLTDDGKLYQTKGVVKN